MTNLSRLDWDIVSARVNHVRTHQNLATASRALLWLVLNQFFPGTEGDLAESITDGPDDRGIDAIHITESDTIAKVFLFQAKHRDSIESTKKTINADECLKICHFLGELFSKSESLVSTGNVRLREAIKRIWNLHERGVYCLYEIVFCTNGAGLNANAASMLDGFCRDNDQVTYLEYGPKDLIRDLGLARLSKETGYLQLTGREYFERVDGDVRGLVASVDARSYIELITHSDGKSVKRHLFDENLRVFLGANSGFNSNIIETAISNDSHLFWYLNNGITITCKNYTYNKGTPNPKVRLDDFQIVNGAQTSHSLAEAYARHPAAFENVVLSVRVYATEREDVAERVAVATNSQARIQGRDLRANHPTLKKMETSLAQRGYFFERKRNMYADKPGDRRIDALKLGQIIMSFYLREPDRARVESDSIFDERFPQIFHESHDVDELTRVIELYRTIETLRDTFNAQYGNSVESGGDYQYLVYGHWFILFAARLIMLKKNIEVPIGPEAEELIEHAIGVVARACNQNKQVAHYQMFRSPKTKEKIAAEISGRQLDLFLLL